MALVTNMRYVNSFGAKSLHIVPIYNMGFHNSKKYNVSNVLMSRMEEGLFGTNGVKNPNDPQNLDRKAKRLPKIVKTALRPLWWATGAERDTPLLLPPCLEGY